MSIGKLTFPRIFPFHRPDHQAHDEAQKDTQPSRDSLAHALDISKARSWSQLYSDRPF